MVGATPRPRACRRGSLALERLWRLNSDRRTFGPSASGGSRALQIEVVPDGKEVRATVNDRLEKTTTTSVAIPPSAIPGSAKVLVKIYPGVFSQVVEGLDSLFHMPDG